MTLKTLVTGMVLALTTVPAFAAEQTVNLSIPGMNCASCPFIVQAAITAVDGVTTVETSLEARTATVVFDDAATTVADITFSTLELGYESSVIQGDEGS